MTLVIQPDTNDVIRLRERSGDYSYWLSEEFISARFGILEITLRTRFRKDYRNTVSAAKRDKDILPDTGAEWRYLKSDKRYYYALANLPEKYRAELNGEELFEQAKCKVKISETLTLKEELKAFVEANKHRFYPHYKGYKATQIERLSEACAALHFCVDQAAKNGGITCAWCMKVGAAFEACQLSYLPSNWRRLKQKADAVATGTPVHEVVDLPRKNNQNRRLLMDPEVESWVIQMRNMGANFTNAYIYRKVALMCELAGKKTPSESWVKELLAQPETKFITAAGRHGERGRKGANYRLNTPVETALFAGDCWQIDGTRVNFLPWKNPTTGREEHLYMVAVRDVHSGAILGVEYCLSEDRWVYLSALEMAVKNAGYLPYELAIDRFPGHNTDEWQLVQKRLETLAGVKVSYKHKATGKAQLERWFGTLQTVFFQDSAYYYGEGIRSNREYAHRAPEYLKAVAKKANDWCFDSAVSEANQCIKNYNETRLNTYSRKHKTVDKSPLELHHSSEKKNVRMVAVHHRALLFGLAKEVSIRNGMIRTEIQKQEYFYNLPYEVVKQHQKVLIAYHLDDLSSVFIFPAGSGKEYAPTSIGTATLQERVQVFGPDADMRALGKHQARMMSIQAQREADLAEKTSAGSPVHLLMGGLSRKADIEAAESAMIEDFTPKVIGTETPKVAAIPNEIDDFDAEQFVLSQM